MADEQHMDMDELLVKYLAGEADAAEKQQVEAWLNAGEENRRYFEHFKLIWDKSALTAAASTVDEDAAWGRFRERVQQNYTAEPKSSQRRLQWLKVAVILLLAVGGAMAGRYFIGNNNGGTRTVFTDEGNSPSKLIKSVTLADAKTDTLSDGSVVKLGAYSTLNYPRAFSAQRRYVELTGEAFFSVNHEEVRPFIIKANDLLITVLGTSFNVKTTGDSTEVSVSTGMVSVTKGKHIVKLNAGERLAASVRDTALGKPVLVVKTSDNSGEQAKAGSDNALDFRKHPDLLQKLLKDPTHWSTILKSYHAKNDDIRVRKAVVRSVIIEIQREKLAGNDGVKTFRLNENEFFINEIRQPDIVQKRFKAMFLKEPGYRIYFSDAPQFGRGVYLNPDSL